MHGGGGGGVRGSAAAAISSFNTSDTVAAAIQFQLYYSLWLSVSPKYKVQLLTYMSVQISDKIYRAG